MKHEAKILPEWFEALLSGRKSFEVRKDDRDPKYQTGDELFLREFDGIDYTGRTITAEVTFVLRNEYCREGFCILSVIVKDSSPQRPVTRYDQIRSMSVEQMAEYHYSFTADVLREFINSFGITVEEGTEEERMRGIELYKQLLESEVVI